VSGNSSDKTNAERGSKIINIFWNILNLAV
jgi:hypothetical protein